MNVVNSLGRDRRGEGGLVRVVAWTELSALPVVILMTILLLSREESLVLRLTRVKASIDLKRQRDDEFLKGFFKSKDAGGFHSYSWQRSVA